MTDLSIPSNPGGAVQSLRCDAGSSRRVPWLRDPIAGPRVGGLLGMVEPSRRADFQAFIEGLWSEILRRLAHPIAIRETPTRRSVTVLGFARFVVDRRSGVLSLQNLVIKCGVRRFQRADFIFSADLPLRPSIGLFEDLLREWEAGIRHFAAGPWFETRLVTEVNRVVRRACLAGTRWQVLRHGVRQALALEAEALDIARRTRRNVQYQEVTQQDYNHVLENIAELRRLREDNPNILWLYGLMRSDGISLPFGSGGLIEALRGCVVDRFRLPPSAWRFVASGRRRDFRLVLEWLGPRAEAGGRWLELREWLRLRVALAMQEDIPPAVQRLLLHDYYAVAKDGKTVTFRKTELPIQTVRTILREAIARHAEGTLRAFAECELADVLVWARESGIRLDENQQKAGWRHLLRRAVDWKHDAALQSRRGELAWTSLVGPHRHGTWQVVPVTDVWQLHRASQHYRNCMDNYLCDCLAGNVRMFFVETHEGRRVGVVGIVRESRDWRVLDVRGFANVGAPNGLTTLGGLLAARYTLLWQALHPLLEQHLPSGVGRLARTEGAPPNSRASEGDSEDADLIFDDDEPDGDGEVWEEEGDDRACLVCGCREWGCSHLVASVDYFNGGVCAGVLYDQISAFADGLKALLRRLAEAGCTVSGLGGGVDKILGAVAEDLRAPDLSAEFMEEHDWSIRNEILELLGCHPAVAERYWEFDGGMPGCSTAGRDYWAQDPESIIEDLRHMLFDGEGLPGRRAA